MRYTLFMKGEFMRNKLIAVLIGLTLLLGGGMAGASEKQDRKTSNKPAVSSGKCWERTWVTSEVLKGRSTMAVCKAFEQVLNTTCEPPDKLRCNWTLPPGEKRFKKLKWEQLNWKEYWDMAGDINKSGVREDLRDALWKNEEAKERKEFEEGHRSLAITQVDIDNDKKTEHVLRYNLIPCEKMPGVMFGVMTPETKRLDWRFEHVLSNVNARKGAEIMLYNGKAYMLGWDDTWKMLMIYEGSQFAVSINICQFKYTKGGVDHDNSLRFP
jgi:hypothetical protein